MVRRRWWQWRKKPLPRPTDWELADFSPLYVGFASLTDVADWPKLVAGACVEARQIQAGCFHFLNQTVEQPSWHDPNLSQLWRYQLHYFDYVQSLLIWSVVDPSHKAPQTFLKLAHSWIEENSYYAGDGWHPYTISLRSVNWLHAFGHFHPQFIDDAQADVLLSSLYGQGQMLYTDLEQDVRGNHLLENLRALVCLGIAFKGAEPARWLARGLDLLQRETHEQILADGGHFERTPGYHLIVLKDYLEIALWLRRNAVEVPFWLDAALERMLSYLMKSLFADGNVALFKDTARDLIPDPHDLLAVGSRYFADPRYKSRCEVGLYPRLLWGVDEWELFAGWAVDQTVISSMHLSESGYCLLRNDAQQEMLILDVGKPCPDYLPAHAHADLLSYELMVNGRFFIVDSGVYEYAAGSWRDYFRSTRAHNTVEVAEMNQSEVWSSFRVARRATPKVHWWEVREDGIVIVQAEHDGYMRLTPSVIHRRTLVYKPDAFWFVVDEVLGEGETAVSSHIHLHPNVILQDETNLVWKMTHDNVTLWLTCVDCENISLQIGQIEPKPQGWYAAEFGKRQPNNVLALHQMGSLPFRFGYLIAKDKATTSVQQVNQTYQLTNKKQTLTLAFTQEGRPQLS